MRRTYVGRPSWCRQNFRDCRSSKRLTPRLGLPCSSRRAVSGYQLPPITTRRLTSSRALPRKSTTSRYHLGGCDTGGFSNPAGRCMVNIIRLRCQVSLREPQPAFIPWRAPYGPGLSSRNLRRRPDSARINDGIVKARSGPIVASHDDIMNPYPRAELDALLHRAILNEERPTHPTLHRMTRDERLAVLPLLAARSISTVPA